MTIQQDYQAFDPGELVVLFEVDAGDLGAGVFRFVEATKEGKPISWQGNLYTPMPIEASGFEMKAEGTLPKPKLRVSNVSMSIGAAVISYEGLLGSTVKRYRTFKKYLDGEPQADSNAHFPVDIYKISRKSGHNKEYVEFELSSVLDYEGQKLPMRQILRDTCTHRYRRWTGASFDYSKATCPYTGSSYWDSLGNEVTDPAEDRCGKRLSDCKNRFPDEPLPTRAFPGVSRVRV